MTKEQTLKNRIATKHKLEFNRLQEIDKWPQRLGRLESREIKPLSEAAFCEKYGLSKWQFNRVKNLAKMSSQEYFEKVEKALRKEGV